MNYLAQLSTGPVNYLRVLLEKWLTFSFYFAGEVTIPLCMAALGELLLNKHEILSSLKIKVENEEKSVPAAILKAFLLYIFNTSAGKEITHKKPPSALEEEGAEFGDDFDELYQEEPSPKSKEEYEPEINRTKDADLLRYPEIQSFCGKMSTMIAKIQQFRVTHKPLFEKWKCELDEDEQQRIDIHFPAGSQ